MKRTIYSVLAFAFLFAFACSSGGDEENITPDPNPNTGTPTNPSTGGDNEIEGAQNRVLLLEEVTGQDCPLCPAAHSTLKTLINNNSGKIAPVAIQAGGLTGDLKFDKGFKVANDYLGISGQPFGTINRTGTLSPSSWASKVTSELEKDPYINLSLEKTYDASSKSFSVTVKGDVKKAIDKATQVTVYLIEDNVIANQVGGSNSYDHDHVLRAVLSDYKGDVWKSSALAKDEELSMSFSMTLSDSWNASNVQVIAFIHEKDSKYVHQAIIESIQ